MKSRGSKKATQFTESVIREMTRLAQEHDAVNLSQGFPDFAAHQAIKDAARVLGFPYQDGDRLTKMYPPLIMGRDAGLKKALEERDKFNRWLIEDKDPKIEREAMQAKGVELTTAATHTGATTHGRLVAFEEMAPIDLVVVGCVAVARDGGLADGRQHDQADL